MADFTLSLGGVDFAGFEIPDSIKGGGAQSLETHKYGGGLRTVDAFGPDDDPISWQGIFLDGSAEARCQQLDAMRKAGEAVPLSYSSFSYLVIIKSFTWDFEKYYQIPYSISLEVVQDNVQPNTDDAVDPETDMQGDVDDLVDFDDDLGDSGFSDAFNTLTGLISTAQSITGASIPVLNQISAGVAGVASVAGTLSGNADTQLELVGQAANFSSGTDPSAMVNNLIALSGAAEEQPAAFCAENSALQLGKSVASVLTGG